MDIRYFYVSNHIRNKTLSLKHCPTEEMIADYFTKPLQGALFIRLRNHIMGAEFGNGDSQTHRSVLGAGDDDTHITTKVLEQTNHDQSESNSSPTVRDQIHDNMQGMSEDQDQNNEKARDGSQDQEQNCETTHVKTGESKGANEKQMTYQEALLK